MSSENRIARAEINRLNKSIAGEEQSIFRLYQEIGQSYFSAHQNDPEESQRSRVQAVLEAMERIKTCKDQINVLRGIAVCPNCMAEVSSSAAFCSRCGTKMPGQTPAPNGGGPVCPKCGRLCAPGNRFCNRCGTRLPEEQAQTTTMAQPSTAQDSFAPSMPAAAPTQSFVGIPVPTPAVPPSPAVAEPPVMELPATVFPATAPEEALPGEAPMAEQPPEAAPVPESPAPAKRRCPHCGTEMEDDYRFCLECGVRL